MNFAPGMQITAAMRLVRQLSRGAMGSVWVAEHRGLGRHVAVKFVGATKGPDAVARFNREAESAAKIRSPHVVRIYEYGTTPDGTPYLVMELLVGQTLEKRLERQGMLTVDDAGKVLRQVGNALDAAHARGIIHRDIKPDNIFLVDLPNGFPLVKVLDFGTAKALRGQDEELTATGVAIGTPEYMSPEQVLGGKDVDLRSDLWALAVVSYRMVTGHVPFVADTPHALFFTICKGDFRPLAKTPGPLELEPWFKRAFEPNKERRYGSAREMVLRFEQAVSQLAEMDAEDSYDDDANTQLLSAELVMAQARAAGLDLRMGRAKLDEAPDSAPLSDPLGATLALGQDAAHEEEDQLPTQQIAPDAIADVVAKLRARERAAASQRGRSALDEPPESITMPQDRRRLPESGTVPAPQDFDLTVRGGMPQPRDSSPRVPAPSDSGRGSSPSSPSSPRLNVPPPRPSSPRATSSSSPSSPNVMAPQPPQSSPRIHTPPPMPTSSSSPRLDAPPPRPSAPSGAGLGGHPHPGLAGHPHPGPAGHPHPGPASPVSSPHLSGQTVEASLGPFHPTAASAAVSASSAFAAPARLDGDPVGAAIPWANVPVPDAPARARRKSSGTAVYWVLLVLVLLGGAGIVLKREGLLDGLLARIRTTVTPATETAQVPPAPAPTTLPASPPSATASATPAVSASAVASADVPTKGFITIRCQPACIVTIDKQRVGVAPVDRHEVDPGKHQVILTRTGFQPKVFHVEVDAGQSAEREEAMNIPAPQPAPQPVPPPLSGSAGPAPAPAPAPDPEPTAPTEL